MAKIISSSLLALALCVALPAFAVAQDAGTDAYVEEPPTADGGNGDGNDGGSDDESEADDPDAAVSSTDTTDFGTTPTSGLPPGPTEAQATRQPTASGSHPNTGLETFLLTAFGSLMLAAGLGLRRRTARTAGT